MKKLFDDICDEGYAAVSRLWEHKTQETVQLEFKQKARSDNGRLEPDDFDNLGKTLSAFANSAGGLLVWGVRTEKHGKGQPDAAARGVPIAELALFQSELVRATGEALMPRHAGIEIVAVEDPSRPASGYIAIWVDRSDRRPHRAERTTSKYYYKRAGSSTFAMEHYDIEDAFNRNAPSNLELVLGGTIGAALEGRPLEKLFRITMEFCLRNHSATSGCAPYVRVDRVEGGNTVAIPTSHLKYSAADGRVLFAGDASTFVHPGLDIPAFRIKFQVMHHLGMRQWFFNDDSISRAFLRLSVGVGCQNSRIRMLTIQYEADELQALIQKALPR